MATPELGAFIRELREKRTTLTLRGFAREMGLSAGYVCDVELGRRIPSKRRLRQMAVVLEPDYKAHIYDLFLVKADKMSPERVALLALRKVLQNGLQEPAKKQQLEDMPNDFVCQLPLNTPIEIRKEGPGRFGYVVLNERIGRVQLREYVEKGLKAGMEYPVPEERQ